MPEPDLEVVDAEHPDSWAPSPLFGVLSLLASPPEPELSLPPAALPEPALPPVPDPPLPLPDPLPDPLPHSEAHSFERHVLKAVERLLVLHDEGGADDVRHVLQVSL